MPLILSLPKNRTSHGLFAHQVPHAVKHFSNTISVRAPNRSKYPVSISSQFRPFVWRRSSSGSPSHVPPVN